MHIISRSRLREFWEQDARSRSALDEWFKRLKKLKPANIAELRQTFPHADPVGTCIVFNIGGNKYRLVTKIDFHRQTVYVRHVMTHKEYDKEKWKTDCS